MSWCEEIKKTLWYCGENVFIGHNVIFTSPKRVVLHDRVRIDPFSIITTSLEVHSNCQIMSHAVLSGGAGFTVTLKGWNFIGYGSKVFCASEDYSGQYGPVNEFWGSNHYVGGDVVFEEFSGIASEVIVMPNITLPEGCAVGAQSLVYRDRDLEPYTVYAGNPLRKFKDRNPNLREFVDNPEWVKKMTYEEH